MKHLILCMLFPVLLNAQKDTLVKVWDMSIDSMGDLKMKYSCYGDLQGNLEYFKNDKWIVLRGIGWTNYFLSFKGDSNMDIKPSFTKQTNKDSIRVKFHKGINKYRIKIDKPVSIIYPEIILNSKVSNDDGSIWVMGTQIILENKEYWEIISNKDGLLKKGESKIIDISFLEKGTYWLYTPKATKTFTKQ